MKFTLSWLKDHLDTDASAADIAEALTHLGLELEEIQNPAEALRPFTIVHVLEAVQHPNADRLRVCKVDTGSGEPLQVVCGAPNARAGMKTVFAPPGTYVPGIDTTLKVGVIRGVESNGMMCSERELLLSEEHNGIIDLPEDAPVGASYAAWIGLDDPVIDVGVTPNRPDALGVYGIARDLAAKGIGTLKPIAAEPVAGTFASPISVELSFGGDNKPCPHFVGRTIRGVKNGPSPDWMQKRLRAIGLRPISALVDITNYMTFAYGRPLHVFDADKLAGTRLTVRSATPIEPLQALNGKLYMLHPGMTVIADDDRGNGVESLGGIMGGEASGCSDETTTVFLEAAYFDPIRTAETGRKLGIHSDARYRFERGIDPAFTQAGAEIATRMILDLCGGEASELVIAGEAPVRDARYSLRLERTKTLAGVDVPADEQVRILRALGFTVDEAGDRLDVGVPSWRPDVDGEADLVEEVIRVHGLDNIESLPLPRLETVTGRRINTAQRRRFLAARTLAARGMNEAVTWSFLSTPRAELFGGGQTGLQLANPISSELTDMRPSLVPNLIAAVGRNVARGFANVSLFEAGQVYGGDRPKDERINVTGVRRGDTGPRHWEAKPRAYDVFDAKADALAVLQAAGAPIDRLQIVAEGPSWYHPGRVGSLMLGPKNRLATFGEIHPRVLDALDVTGPLVAFEVDLDAIPLPKSTRTARPALNASDLQAVTRDFAFAVETTVTADQIARAARGADKALITDAVVFDVFEGASLGEGRKSVAIEVTLQPRDRTLTDEEIEGVTKAVVAAVEKATGGTLRS
ncbi:phenylalanyl-tRNA synthetase beta subunit [Faunimonas pinastri]|uniref:Phenylalanine--tRNA ligase beta subunit n=1 Tax=Faunimonas pinastri TaxID=1855383 RepID=A0A1H9GZ63_9HYPH|nr:phenylalanine--tRNA ligase subunit beta [Faunimonas pinastri]SEQ55345.1 phenylalanyl-tRNA synthetase beta subunit [Faunimonas pinastri]